MHNGMVLYLILFTFFLLETKKNYEDCKEEWNENMKVD